MPVEYVLETSHLTKMYDSKAVVDHISLDSTFILCLLRNYHSLMVCLFKLQ